MWASLPDMLRTNVTNAIRETVENLKQFPKHVVVSIIVRVYCNDLPTSFRMHSKKRSCIWCGADGHTDRLTHIVVCPVFWATLSTVLDVQYAPTLMQALMLEQTAPPMQFQNKALMLHILVDTYQNMCQSTRLNLISSLRAAVKRTSAFMSLGLPCRSSRTYSAPHRTPHRCNRRQQTPPPASVPVQVVPSVVRSMPESHSGAGSFSVQIRMPPSFGGMN